VADPITPVDPRTAAPAAPADVGGSGRAIVHGTAIAWLGRGILLLGRPGSGKSDLALRLIEAGALLVADDLVALEATGNRLVARAHGAPGLIELRGQGIFRQAALAEAAIDIVVRLGPAPSRSSGCRRPARWRSPASPCPPSTSIRSPHRRSPGCGCWRPGSASFEPA
jgi:hypothetical protein